MVASNMPLLTSSEKAMVYVIGVIRRLEDRDEVSSVICLDQEGRSWYDWLRTLRYRPGRRSIIETIGEINGFVDPVLVDLVYKEIYL